MPLALLRFEDRSSKKMPKLCESAVSNFAMYISEDSVNMLVGQWFSTFGGGWLQEGGKAKSLPCRSLYVCVYHTYILYTRIHEYMVWKEIVQT